MHVYSSYGKSELAAVLSRTQRRTVFWSSRISLSGGESFGCTMTAELDGNVFFCAVHKPSCAGELFPNYTEGNKIAHIDMASLPDKLLSGGPRIKCSVVSVRECCVDGTGERGEGNMATQCVHGEACMTIHIQKAIKQLKPLAQASSSS